MQTFISLGRRSGGGHPGHSDLDRIFLEFDASQA